MAESAGGPAPRLVLASASPRRLELLRLAALQPVVRPAAVDETVRPGEEPFAYVARLARAKACAVECGEDEVVLGADTTVIHDGQAIGKPDGDEHAAAILRRLSGRAHTVATAVALIDRQGELREHLATTEVVFTALRDETIAAYVATGEPHGKAGAYAIQGRAAALVERIDGSWTNVVGLPLVETLAMLRAVSVPIP